MLDKFFRYIKTFPVTFTTLPEAIKLYHEKNRTTASCYILSEDFPQRPDTNEYTLTLGGTGTGPWPETFFYYDNSCQMAFVKGECVPRTLRSYIGKWNMNDEFTEKIPQVFVTHYQKTGETIEMTFEIGYSAPIPFGLVYWDELSGYEIDSCPDAYEVRMIQDKLVFMRFDLDGGKKRIGLKLKKKG